MVSKIIVDLSGQAIRKQNMPMFEALGQIRANRVFSPIRIETRVIRVQSTLLSIFWNVNSQKKGFFLCETRIDSQRIFRAATLQKCGSEICLRFSLPKVSWNLAWNFGEIFRATFSRVWVSEGKLHQNFTSNTVWKKKENITQRRSAGAQCREYSRFACESRIDSRESAH